MPLETEALDRALRGAVLAGGSDDDEVALVPLGAHLGEGLEEGDEPLQGDVARGGGEDPPRDTGDLGDGGGRPWVDPDGDDAILSAATPISATMSRRRTPRR